MARRLVQRHPSRTPPAGDTATRGERISRWLNNHRVDPVSEILRENSIGRQRRLLMYRGETRAGTACVRSESVDLLVRPDLRQWLLGPPDDLDESLPPSPRLRRTHRVRGASTIPHEARRAHVGASRARADSSVGKDNRGIPTDRRTPLDRRTANCRRAARRSCAEYRSEQCGAQHR